MSNREVAGVPFIDVLLAAGIFLISSTALWAANQVWPHWALKHYALVMSVATLVCLFGAIGMLFTSSPEKND